MEPFFKKMTVPWSVGLINKRSSYTVAMSVRISLYNGLLFISGCTLVFHILFLSRNIIDTSLVFSTERVAKASTMCDQEELTCFFVTTPLMYTTESIVQMMTYYW